MTYGQPNRKESRPSRWLVLLRLPENFRQIRSQHLCERLNLSHTARFRRWQWFEEHRKPDGKHAPRSGCLHGRFLGFLRET
jgi:hypothetical protein